MTNKDNTYYLVVDQGGQASRAMVINRHGHIISENRQTIAVSRPDDYRVEYAAKTIIQSLQKAIAEAIKAIHPDIQIQAAGLATQRSNVLCWNRVNGKPLSAVLSWQDRRGQSRLNQFNAAAEFIHRHTGLHLSAYYGASKLHWCLNEIPEVLTALQQQQLAMGPMASFIAQNLLAGQPFIVDAVNASRTLLWDIDSHDWSDALLEIFSIPRQTLPRCTENQADFGLLTAGNQQIPMKVITGDQSAALLAWGPPQNNTAYITVGTGAFIQRYTGQRRLISTQLLTGLVNLGKVGPLYCLEGTVNGAASALNWACNQLGLSAIENKLDDWLDAHQQPPLFLNGISGLGTPYLGQTLKSRYIGQGTQQEYIVAVIESIIFLINKNLEIMADQLGPAEKILLGGGFSRLNGFCQRLADLSQNTVFKANHHETTSIGMAYILAGKPSQWPPSKSFEAYTPRSNTGIYRRYQQWCMEFENSIQND